MATITFYPDPHTESSTVDGSVRSVTSSSWNTAHDTTSGSFDDSSTTFEVSSKGQNAPTRYVIRRGITLFDTTAIGDGEITAATLGLYVTAKTNTDNDGDDFLVVTQASPASNTTLANGDFDNVGAVDNPTEGSDQIDIGSITTSAYNTFTLDATGRGWVDGTGITKLGIREGHDVQDIAYAGTFCVPWGCGNIVTIASADAAGYSTSPKLTVTYTPSLTAISPDGISNPGLSNPGTTLTVSHTCAGTNRFLYVPVYTGDAVISSVTYNGDSLTEIGSRMTSGSNHFSQYYMVAPDTGTHDIVITMASSVLIIGGGVSYTGVSQSAPVDASTTNDFTSEATTTTSITTTVDDDWTIMAVRNTSSGTTLPGTGTMQRAATNGYMQIYDSGGVEGTAGSKSLISTQSSSNTGAVMIAISPAEAVTFTPYSTIF